MDYLVDDDDNVMRDIGQEDIQSATDAIQTLGHTLNYSNEEWAVLVSIVGNTLIRVNGLEFSMSKPERVTDA